MMANSTAPAIEIYTRRWCWYCKAARCLLNRLGFDYREIKVDGQSELRREVSERAGNWPTLPMIFIGDRFIGGYREVADLHRRGTLEKFCIPDE